MRELFYYYFYLKTRIYCGYYLNLLDFGPLLKGFIKLPEYFSSFINVFDESKASKLLE